jgi:3-oxoacyl-[acyl-carrier-protein] synthase-3
MSSAVTDILERIGATLDDVALVIPHQANQRILDAVAKSLGAEGRVYSNIADYGNTGSATVPFALWESQEKGRIRPGDLVILAAFGAGFHWGAAAIRF